MIDKKVQNIYVLPKYYISKYSSTLTNKQIMLIAQKLQAVS